MRTLYPVGNAMVELNRHQITNSYRLRLLRSLRRSRLAFASRDGNLNAICQWSCGALKESD
jgi:hypothetical protein